MPVTYVCDLRLSPYEEEDTCMKYVCDVYVCDLRLSPCLSHMHACVYVCRTLFHDFMCAAHTLIPGKTSGGGFFAINERESAREREREACMLPSMHARYHVGVSTHVIHTLAPMLYIVKNQTPNPKRETRIGNRKPGAAGVHS